jgi:hypothetical protein
MKLSTDKQLRLVGGNQHSPRPGFSSPPPQYTLTALRDRLGKLFPVARVSLIPPSADFFRQDMYLSAVAAPRHAGQPQPERFDVSTQSATSSLSADSGIFIDAPATVTTPLRVEGRNPEEGPKSPSERDVAIVPCNEGELAGLIRVKYLNSDDRPKLHKTAKGPKMKGDVARSIASMTEDTRHQWAACGGSGDMLRNAAFVGHLHDCLMRGGM